MDKEYALGKDGLPLTVNCNYLKIAEDDLPLVKSLLDKNNISYKDNVEPYDFCTEHEVESSIIADIEANNFDFDINESNNQKKIFKLLEKTNVVQRIQSNLDLDNLFYDIQIAKNEILNECLDDNEDDELLDMLYGLKDSKEA